MLRSYLQFGGFPAAVRIADDQIRTEYLSMYFESILFRDIEEQHDIHNPSVLRKLLRYAAANISVLFSYRKFAKVFGTDPRIVADYLGFSEEAFLFFTVQRFSYSLKSQELSGKKLYMIDTGLRNAVAFRFSADEGRLVENAVYVHLRRYNQDMYFWQGSGEVDFLIRHRDNSFTAINVCYSDDIPEREVRGLQECSAVLHVSRMILITKDTLREEGGILFVPLWKWLLADPLMI
jgi:predicted AAA+ superfamily ATPase